jgi:transcriptional regulator with XRE-family HTH domain
VQLELFSSRVGLGARRIRFVERGERNLTILNLRLIARVLWAPLGELLNGTA